MDSLGRRGRLVVALAAWLRAAPALADEPNTDAAPVSIHAFVSQGAIKTTANNYLANSKRGSVDFTEVGINFTSALTEKLRMGVQLFAHDLGPVGNYAPTFDWYFLDYRFSDWLGLRAGRTKIPFGLYNDSADIDAARVPILLPQSVYPISSRDYLLAQTGLELYGSSRIGSAGRLSYRAYGGTLDVNVPAAPAPGVTVSGLEVPYVAGGRLLWLPPLDGLTLAGSYQALRFDWDYHLAPETAAPLQGKGLLPTTFDGTLPVKFRIQLWVASLEYQTGGLTIASEYSRWIGHIQSNAPKLLPARVESERYYAMLSYQVTPWLAPGAYYSVLYPNVKKRSGRENYQHDAALSLRFDVNQYWLVKLEGHFMRGTAALDTTLNAGTQRQDLTRIWEAFLIKTTAYF